MLYWLGIWIGAALSIAGGIAGLVLMLGFGPELFHPDQFGQFISSALTVTGPVGSILGALASLKQRLLVDIWVSEIGGLVTAACSLLMLGYIATSRLSLLPGVVSFAGSMLVLIATDEIKPMPSD